MEIRLTVPNDVVTADIIDRALETSTATAETQVSDVPSIYDAIAHGLVVWRPEPRGQGYESFDLPKKMLARGWGDCDDLAPWLAAELRFTGVDPDARARVYQSGPNRWHAVVQRGDGSVDDPSRWAGMRKVVPVAAAAERPLLDVSETTMAVGVGNGCYVCRIDLSCDHCEPQGLSVRTSGSTPLEAVVGAAENAFQICLSANLDPKTVRQVYSLLAALHGHSLDEIEHVTGVDSWTIGALVPTICAASQIGDGILSTIFDPLGIHHVFDPLLQQALTQTQSQARPGQVLYQPNAQAMDLLKSIIGAHTWGSGKGEFGPDPHGHKAARALHDKNKKRALQAQRDAGSGSTRDASGTQASGRMRPDAVDPQSRRAPPGDPSTQTRGQSRAESYANYPADDGGDDDDDGPGYYDDGDNDDWQSPAWDS